MIPRKIAVVTGTRAEYGLLSPLLRLIRADRALRLQLLVTGQHLAPEFGRTVREIEADGFPIAARVSMPLRADTGEGVAAAVGAATAGFAKALARLRPDLLVVLGDRYEILAAAAAALPLRIPVAHIHGGESTEGLIDEQIRHSVTKLSHLHFPVTERYRRRILRMGENPKNVFCFGAPGVDGLSRLKFRGREDLFRELGVPAGRRVGVVTFHPVTLEEGTAGRQSAELLRALKAVPGFYWVCTLPNAEAGCRAVIRNLRRFAKENPGIATARVSLGKDYRSLLKHADLMVGNSSSGIIEAPSFGLPVVNIGDRQQGRLRAANVIEAPRPVAAEIGKAIRKALAPAHVRRCRTAKNPYAGKDTCRRIVQALKSAPLGPALIKKRFHDA